MPEHTYSRANPSKYAINELIYECYVCKISSKSVDYIRQLSALNTMDRLCVNLGVLFKLVKNKNIENILADGLTKNERSILAEIDLANFPIRFKEVLLGLLNLHERWIALKALSRSFEDARKELPFSLFTEEDHQKTLKEIYSEKEN